MAVNLRIRQWIVNPIVGLLIMMGTNNPLYTYAAALLSAVNIIICDAEDSLCMLMFCMSFAFVFKRAPQTSSFFTMLILLYVAWNLLKVQRFYAVLGGIVLLVEYVVAVHLANGMMQLVQLLKFAMNILFLYLAVQNVDYDHPRKIFLFYIFGVLVAALLKQSGAFPNIALYTMEDPTLKRFTGLHADPNYYGVNLIISLCLIVVLYQRRELPMWVALVLAGILVWFCSQTVSKMVFLMLVWPALLFLYSNHKSQRFCFQVLFVGIVAVLIVNVLQGKITSFDGVMTRFEAAEDAASLTTGRSEKWAEYISHIFGNAWVTLFGEGLNAPYIIASDGVPHNTYLDFFYHLGMIGTVGFIVVLWQIFALCARRIPRNILNGSVAIGMMVMWFSLSELLYFDFPFHLLLAYTVWNVQMDVKQPMDANCFAGEMRSNRVLWKEEWLD